MNGDVLIYVDYQEFKDSNQKTLFLARNFGDNKVCNILEILHTNYRQILCLWAIDFVGE